MQMIKIISITNGTPGNFLSSEIKVMFGPLLIVISISAIKDIFEDYKKH